MDYLDIDQIYCGDTPQLIQSVRPESIACSFWSPPYHVGKEYEKDQSLEDWLGLLRSSIAGHGSILIPGGFLVINIADILCFRDAEMPRIQAPNVSKRRCSVTRDEIIAVLKTHPDFNRYQLASVLGCSEQTVDRRLKGNNVRGGKYATQTRVQLVGQWLVEFAQESGLYLYDRRIWAKDPAWENCQWHSNSYRSVDEFEYLYFFWKPGETKVDRRRLEAKEWSSWGSRAVWHIPSVRVNDVHEAQFPVELARRVIKLLTDPGDCVLDCFMGSGTTAVAAKGLGRHYLGFDKMQNYVDYATKRVVLS